MCILRSDRVVYRLIEEHQKVHEPIAPRPFHKDAESIWENLAESRMLWFSSPIWISALLILLSYISPACRDIIRFMTASPLR
jgi:hypothetical protein